MRRASLSLCALCLVACLVSTAAADVAIQLPGPPALSPDGKRVAFSWQGDIWDARVRGGQVRRLSFHPADESRPVYSRDGEQLAFISNRTGSNQVFVMPAGGGEPRQVTAHSEGYEVHAWFPDGKSILTTGNRDHHWRDATRLIRVWVDGSRGEEVLIDAAAESPSLSPDGKQILFVREGTQWWRKGYRGSAAAQVWLLDLESRETRQLIGEQREAHWPVWAHDGKGFYFAMGDTEGFDLWRATLPDDAEQAVETERVVDVDTHSVLFLTAAAEAPTLVYRHGFDLYRWNGDPQTAPKQIKLRAIGDGLRDEDELRRTLTSASEVAFHPDGLEIAMIAGGDVWVMDTTLREPVRVTDTPAYETSITWGPNGDSLWFVSSREGQDDIYRAQRAQEETYWWRNREFPIEQVTDDAAAESSLRFDPKGERLLYVRGIGELWSRDLESGETTKLVDGFSTPDYDVSPDGRWLAYSHEDDNFNSEVFLMPMDRSTEPVNISQHPDNDAHPRFSLDGKMLAFTGRRFASETDIFYLYLEKQFDELTSRDRKLEQALEKLQEEREKKSDDKKQEDPSDDTAEDAQDPAGVKVDFDQIEQRIRHISLPNVDEHGLVWVGDSKLAFEGRINGRRGFYTLEFPDKRTPKLLTETTGGSVHWSPEAKAIFLATRGKPAKIEASGKVTEYPFAAFQTLSRPERYAHGFDVAWQTMRDRYYDPRLGGKNWDQIRRRYRDAASQATDNQMFGEVIRLMLGELNGSHHGFYPEGDERRFRGPSHPDRTPHLGLRFETDQQGPGLKVRDVLPGGPTDRAEFDIAAGDRVVSIDGHKVDPSCDLTAALNGRMDRDILVEYQKPDADQTQKIAVRPISYGQARSSLYNQWIDTRRKAVEEQSDGKLGYLHIRKMDQESFHEFERQLYAAGNGKQGLVIDVRDNGGGSTTDLLLTSLTQPRHAITVPRNGGPGYPHDRQVFATWHKPIIVLCNQNSFSNAEIFSHAIKTLNRGKLVGVPTAGGVISTSQVRVIDLGRMRMPRRGWFVVGTGEDMELSGAQPDEILWPKPGELPAGVDRQLERAVELLAQEVADLPDDPEPKYAADRESQED